MLNQMTQNLVNNNGQDLDFSIDLPGLDVDVDIDIDKGDGGTDTPTTPTPTNPTTLRDVLLDLVNEQVEVTTPFGTVTGTLLAVRENYIAIIDSTGNTVLVRIEKIEFVSEL